MGPAALVTGLDDDEDDAEVFRREGPRQGRWPATVNWAIAWPAAKVIVRGDESILRQHPQDDRFGGPAEDEARERASERVIDPRGP